MPIPEQLKQQWKQFRKDCKATGVELTVADFLGVTFTDEEYNTGRAGIMSWKSCLARREQPKTLAAHA